jgi:hypothetical protein
VELGFGPDLGWRLFPIIIAPLLALVGVSYPPNLSFFRAGRNSSRGVQLGLEIHCFGASFPTYNKGDFSYVFNNAYTTI